MYTWTNAAGTTPWTLQEKRQFHRAVDTQVWRHWSNRVHIRTSGTAHFALNNPTISINFDIRWVTSGGQWTVRARKLPVGSTPTTYISNVDRTILEVNLDSADLSSYHPCNSAGRCRDFHAVPHEFGHTFPGVATNI